MGTLPGDRDGTDGPSSWRPGLVRRYLPLKVGTGPMALPPGDREGADRPSPWRSGRGPTAPPHEGRNGADGSSQ
jgi:hypothetical protein